MARSLRFNLIANIRQILSLPGIKITHKMQVHWLANVATFCSFITYVLQTVALIHIRHDMEIFFERSGDWFYRGMSLFKLFILRRNQVIWCSLIEQVIKIEEIEFLIECDKHRESFIFSEHIQTYSVKFEKVKKVITRIFVICTVMYASSPVLEYGLRKLTQTGRVDLPHILHIWSPLDNISFIGYIITVIIEFISVFYDMSIQTTFDLTSVGIMIFISGQFSLIRHYSEHIGCKEEIFLSKKQDDLAQKQIIICHQIHILIKHLASMLKKLLRDILGVYFIMSTIMLCSIAVRLNFDTSFIQLITMFLYMCGIMVQLFLFCYYCDDVLNKSTIGMGEGPYGAAYWSLSPRIRRELMILAMGMSRPCQLYAGPFIVVTLPSFVQIIRTACSYYAVLGNRG